MLTILFIAYLLGVLIRMCDVEAEGSELTKKLLMSFVWPVYTIMAVLSIMGVLGLAVVSLIK